ncbi:hypothetical protein CECT5772_05653 [Streptococcus equi subsp. ruminatorum CECT 5772]|uniref:Uncharacterized protein n=1 Tax=Streptococcus equi subsp. ruminatorum CECT 5772 TaxID=1051981 RepID=A0A922T4Q0_9STRE|nr:hypothetical protein CECT5772_05653 [Streptococcus equi subsp. ruminatorum CECT 5772]
MRAAHDMLESVLAAYIDCGMELPAPMDLITLTVDAGFTSLYSS